jgi:hypothetical protein
MNSSKERHSLIDLLVLIEKLDIVKLDRLLVLRLAFSLPPNLTAHWMQY